MLKRDFIVQDLISKIYMQRFENGKLPSQRQLAKEYSVSRFTIQEVIKELSNIGIIHTIPGSGIFVKDKIKKNPLVFNSLTKTPYKHIESKPLHLLRRKATKEEETIFQMKGDVFEFSRVRYVNYQAEQLEISCLPTALFPTFNEEVVKGSIQQYVESCGYKISHNLTTYTPITLNKEYAEILFSKKGTPAMSIHNRSFLKDGRVFECSNIIAIDYEVSYIRPFDRKDHKQRFNND